MSVAAESQVSITVMVLKDDFATITIVEEELNARGHRIPRKNLNSGIVSISGELTEEDAENMKAVFFTNDGMVMSEYGGRIFSIDWQRGR